MNGREFARYLARDLRCPCGCVGREDTFVPQHRAGRGMGGSKLLNVPSNILVMCSILNGAIESDPNTAQQAREYGWKLFRWQDPETTPFYDLHDGTWNLIDNNFNRTTTKKAAA
jgi:hypothetical protein